MRRSTFELNDDFPRSSIAKRSNTFVIGMKKSALQSEIKNYFVQSHCVVSYFIDEILIDKCLEEMEKRQLPKLINQAIKQCDFYFRHQTWQIDPQGPYKQKAQQSTLKPDIQPQCNIVDPMLTSKKYKNNFKSLRNSLSLSSFTKNSPKNNRKHIFANHHIDRKQSTISNTSKLSKPKFNVSDINFIPLRFEDGITPQLSSRKTLEDFLREKKKSTDGNIGHKIPSFPQEKDSLKIITEIPKSNFFTTTTTSKNSQLLTQHEKHEKHEKLPQIFARQELGTDYDGKAIQIKKFSNLKKPAHVLKMVCKLKQQNSEIRKQYIQYKYLNRPEQIKLKPINQRKHTTNNITSLTLRLNSQQDVKSLVENGLYTNRIKFRYQQQNGDNNMTQQH